MDLSMTTFSSRTSISTLRVRCSAATKKYPRLRRFALRYWPPRKVLRRLIRPARLWPVFRTTIPLSARYGCDRGKPIDRHYIEQFLARHAASIRGVCLEVKDCTYTHRFGSGVTRSDVLDVDPRNRRASIIGDLRHLDAIPANTYDCVILTQVLQYIDDCASAIRECGRVLAPGGMLLVTAPALGRMDHDSGMQGDFWRFTVDGMRYLFAQHFPGRAVSVDGCGNVLAGVGFWVGCACEDLTLRKLARNDPRFPILITVVARK